MELMSVQKILIIDDEQDIVEFLGYNLEKAGFQVKTAYNGIEGLKIAEQMKPDLVVLDVMMPEMDGIETCQEIRKRESLSKTIVLFLTARSEDYSQIAGFDAGADDYVNKPINPRVLISRIQALLKRKISENKDKETARIKINQNIVIDREKYIVLKDDESLNLPRKEFELLSLLATKPGKVFTREEIYDSIWGNSFVGDRTIDVHIRKLREKLGKDHILTIKGVGYKFQE
jgi:two-component system, OmpR family, alkaline phosphatase synthesis response regulator PhoP